MSEQMYAAKIDWSKVDKTKLFKGKNGAEYLDVILMPVRESKYGESHFITQSVSKEDRARGVKGAILGNAKPVGQSAPMPAPARRQEERQEQTEDIPF